MHLWDWFVKLIISLNLWSPRLPSTTVYIGTYSGEGAGDSKGIYAFALDEDKATLTPLGLAAPITNASYVLIHPSHKYLYAVNEEDEGGVTAFAINSSQPGRLNFLNHQSSRGSGPCYLSTNHVGSHLFVANYNNGTVAVFPINSENGSLHSYSGFDQQTGSSIDPVRQTSAHAHCIVLDKREEFALSADLGSDQIYRYQFSPSNGTIARVGIVRAARAGDGPRHLIFNSNQRFVYVMNELKSEITVFNYSPIMDPIQIISSLPANFTEFNTGAEILLHPISERYLYASNRGHNSIAVFSVEPETGHLTLLQHVSVQGQTPRNFNISPNGKFLIVANQDSHNVVLFKIDENTGLVSATGASVEVSHPTCVKYLVQ